jgi:site-specific recombinase XerD
MPIRGIFERPPRSGVWWISYCDGEGKRHREKAGRRSAALDALGRRRLEVKEGRYIPPRAGARLTFRELAMAAMVQKKLRLADLSYETDAGRLQQLLLLIGNLPADQLTPARLEETLSRFKQSGLSGSTVNRFHALVSSIFKFAVKAGRLAVNPARQVSRYKENDSRVRWLRDVEEAQIRKEFVADSHEWEFDLAMLTGMRRGEQFTLRWKNVDFENKVLTVNGKSGRRHVTANEGAIAALRKLQKISGDREFVCPENDGSAKRDWRTWFEEAVDKAGVRDFHWHDLRHTFASRLVMEGVDLRTVQELLGHKSIVQTMKYAHLAQDHRQAAAEKMSAKEERREKQKEREPGQEKEAGQEETSGQETDGEDGPGGVRRERNKNRR